MFTEQTQNSTPELQREISRFFSPEHTQAAKERLNMQHQKRNEASNQLLRKQELKRSHVSEQMNQSNTVVKEDNTFLESTQ